MSTLQIEFKDGKFLSHNGVGVKVATETHIEGNGWVGDVDKDGNFAFLATEFCLGVRHQLKFKIENGYVKKILKIGDAKPKVLKVYKIDNWPIDGVIGLSDGVCDQRVTYFRTSSFQKFLDEHQITAVRYESANGSYKLMEKHNGRSLIFYEKIETDGNSQQISRDIKIDEKSKGKPYTVCSHMEVTDASWVIKTVVKSDKIKHRILYTLDNPQEIVGLPKL